MFEKCRVILFFLFWIIGKKRRHTQTRAQDHISKSNNTHNNSSSSNSTTAMMMSSSSLFFSSEALLEARVLVRETFRAGWVFFPHLLFDETKKMNFRAPSFDVDGAVVCVFSLALFALNKTLKRVALEPIARRCLKTTTTSTTKACQKFAQSAWEALVYSSFFVLGMNIVKTQPWFWPSRKWWQNQTRDARTSAAYRGYYLLYVARYVAEIISVGTEYDRKDKKEMLLHHFSTVFLIGISYAYGFTRVGGIIMLLLDPADVPLHVAKLFKYVADARKNELKKMSRNGSSNDDKKSAMATQRAIAVGKRCQFMADVLFGVFMVTFLITRLVMYPYVVYSSHFECRKFVNVERSLALLIGYWSCIVLLYIVLALQAYWFYLILKVAIKVVTKGEAEDVRSDDEDDDDDEEEDDSDDENELEGKKKK